MMNRSIQISILLMLSLIWLAQIAFIPVFLSILFFIQTVALFWFYQKQVQKKKTDFPKLAKILFVLVALAIIYISYKSFLGVEAGTAVLATFLYAKALETQKKRDLIILFYFALFVSASLFLYSQSFWMALIVLACLISCLVGLYRIQTSQYQHVVTTVQSLKADVKHILKFIGLALPFFILLFLFFPRLPPLWQIPISSNKAVTGVSDRMSPGDIAELSQSSALAFRILGNMKQLPSRQDLYWRAMVLDQYDGTTWTSSDLNKPAKQVELLNQEKSVFEYQYLAADYRTQWVMGLEKSVPLDPQFQLHQDWSITPNRAVQRTQPIRLQWVTNKIASEKDAHYLEFEQEYNQHYIQRVDTKSQELAQQLFQASDQNPEKYISNVLKWYKNNHFIYTLSPGRLGQNRVDDFLFQSRQGFCEHYASSFVMLMRYVGIPARVVVGYQGGALAPDGQSWEVRQLDAHAWTEVYVNDQWQRIDPTFIVAPQRIDQGMQDYIANDQQVFGNTGESNWRYQQYSMLKELRIWSDYASYQWQSKIIGYDAEKQNNWLKKLGLDTGYGFGIILILGLLFLSFVYIVVYKWKQYQQCSALDRVLDAFSKQLLLEQRKTDYETFQQWMKRLSKDSNRADLFDQANLLFQKIMYLEQKDSKVLSNLKNLLKECSTELKKAKKPCLDSEK